MRLQDKALPKFEVSSRYEEYAAGKNFVDPVGGSAGEAASRGIGDEGHSVDAAVDARDGNLSFEERVSAVITCVGSQNALREVLYKTLDHCRETRDFSEVEDFIASQDEFVYSHILQTPFTLIQMLLRAGGLSQTAVDAQGGELSDERCEGLSADEIDELVATYRIDTTPAGLKAVALLSPERRFESQMAQYPHRAETFYRLLDYCVEPRTFPQIQEFFKDTPGLAQDVVAHHHKLSPDYYVDKLDKAGALVWRGAWVATDSGKRILEAHQTHAL